MRLIAAAASMLLVGIAASPAAAASATASGPALDFSQRDTQAGYTGGTALGENSAAGSATARRGCVSCSAG